MLISINAIKIVLIFFFKKNNEEICSLGRAQFKMMKKNEETRAYIKRIIQK